MRAESGSMVMRSSKASNDEGVGDVREDGVLGSELVELLS